MSVEIFQSKEGNNSLFWVMAMLRLACVIWSFSLFFSGVEIVIMDPSAWDLREKNRNKIFRRDSLPPSPSISFLLPLEKVVILLFSFPSLFFSNSKPNLQKSWKTSSLDIQTSFWSTQPVVNFNQLLIFESCIHYVLRSSTLPNTSPKNIFQYNCTTLNATKEVNNSVVLSNMLYTQISLIVLCMVLHYFQSRIQPRLLLIVTLVSCPLKPYP